MLSFVRNDHQMSKNWTCYLLSLPKGGGGNGTWKSDT